LPFWEISIFLGLLELPPFGKNDRQRCLLFVCYLLFELALLFAHCYLLFGLLKRLIRPAAFPRALAQLSLYAGDV